MSHHFTSFQLSQQKKKHLQSDSTIPFAAITHFPTPLSDSPPIQDDDEKIKLIAAHFREIMVCLGLDLNDPSLAKTPERVAKMYVREIFSGLNPKSFPSISLVDNEFQHSLRGNIVFLKVHFHSFCEHHFVPMNGIAYVAYIPNQKVIGLSKIPRLVRYFARRPQLQERLTAQIADALALILDSEHVAVSLTAQHFCVMARGIEDDNSYTTTNVLRGDFENKADTQQQFFECINRKSL